MARYNISAMYEYGTDGIEADSPEEAERIFLESLNDYYQGTYSLDIEEVEDDEDEDE